MHKQGCSRSHARDLYLVLWGHSRSRDEIVGRTGGEGAQKRWQSCWPKKVSSCPYEVNKEGPCRRIMRKGDMSEGHFGIKMIEIKIKRQVGAVLQEVMLVLRGMYFIVQKTQRLCRFLSIRKSHICDLESDSLGVIEDRLGLGYRR